MVGIIIIEEIINILKIESLKTNLNNFIQWKKAKPDNTPIAPGLEKRAKTKRNKTRQGNDELDLSSRIKYLL